MGDEGQAHVPTDDEANPPPRMQPNDSEPSLERQKELRAAYEANMAGGRAPYEGVPVRSRSELAWILQERGWSGAPDTPQQARVNLVGATVSGVDLTRIQLVRANLEYADLEGANLRDANLDFAYLRNADLTGAKLIGARLTGDLTDTDLPRADLRGAFLVGAKLGGADLRQVRMDAATALQDVVLTASTWVGDVVWNGVPLTQVDWTQLPRLGDEQRLADAKTPRTRTTAYHTIARAYRGLAIALREQGLLMAASRFRLREQRMERKALFWEGRLGGWIFSWLLDVVAGYGERPVRTFIAYVATVLGFAAAYFGVTRSVETHLSRLSWDEALVLSLTSFHGRGFFPGFLALGDWVARLAAAEAIIGLFIELVFIATFSRRFLGN